MTARARLARILVGLVACVAAGTLAAPGFAAAFTDAQVRDAVQTWVRTTTPDARPDATIERMEPYAPEGEVVAYVAILRDGGFCLCGADPAVLPVYLYAPRGAYDPNDRNLRAVLDEIAGRTKAQRVTKASDGAAALRALFTAREDDWNALLAGRSIAKPPPPDGVQAAPSWMRLPTEALWDQVDPYNAYLPAPNPNGSEHVLTGCNATATAQIMYWWKWPGAGSGSGSVPYNYRYRLNWDSEPLAVNPGNLAGFPGRLQWTGGQLQMNGYWDNSVFGAAQGVTGSSAYQAALSALWSRMTVVNTTQVASYGTAIYDWSQIHPTHAAPFDASDGELAEFNRHVSIACNSDLGIWSTNSYFGNDIAGLTGHFYYDTDALFTASGGTAQMLTDEIQWGRLAGLGGTNAAGGGHAWVIEGYDTATDPNRNFWMNLGFGGASNAWYTLDSAPFPYFHDMMTRVAPINVKFVGAGVLGDGTPATPYRDMVEALTEAPNGTILHLRAGSDHAWTGTINRPLQIRGYGAIVH